MSDADVAIVRAAYDAMARGDLGGLFAVLAEDVEWHVPITLPFGGRYTGAEEIGGFLDDVRSRFEELRTEPDQFIDAGNEVVVRGYYRGRTAAGDFQVPFAAFWAMRDGKAVRFQEYADTAKLLRALGGPEPLA